MERLLSILLVCSTTARKVVVLDDNEWDSSIVVTSPPVKITNSRFNPKNNTQKENSIDFEHSRVARHVKDCEEGDLKCLYDNQLDETSTQNPQETVDKFLEKYSSVTNVKINNELKNVSAKAYWNQIEAQKHNHPYDDSQGWVTLDPIPWSTSKVSKWKPENQGDRPWAYGPPQNQQGSWINNRPYPGDQSSNSWNSNRPFSGERPSAAWGLGSNDIITDNRPNEFPLDNNYPARPDWGSQNPAIPSGYLPPGPPERPHYTPVQATAPLPSSKPSYPQHYPPTHFQYPPHPPPHQPTYHYEPSRPEMNRPYQWQNNNNNFNSYPSHSIQPVNGNSLQSSGYPHQPSANHPSNYPNAGRGEWVLVSTTKGYSVPQRYHDRKMHVKQVINMSPTSSIETTSSRTGKSKYFENDLEEKYLLASSANSQRKSDVIPEMGNTLWTVDGVNILQANQHEDQAGNEHQWREHRKEKSDEPKEMTFKRTVRLTVLPALNNSSKLSHGGMLEVDSNPQTVEEAQQEQERLKKLHNIAVVSTGRQSFNMGPMVPKFDQTEINRKRAAVIAAVSAGMIPATMALLLPAALGRKRRSVDTEQKRVLLR